MKEPLRVPFESGEPDLAGPRLVRETDGDDRHAVPAFCDELREARLRGGYSLGDAARVLRIQEHYLQALEEGRFGDIPGTTYTLGFLRSYAGFLALDPDQLIDAFKREQGLQTGAQRLSFPAPSDTSPKPKLWLILVVLVLAGLAYGGWQYQSTGGQIATDLVADVSTRLTEAVGLGETDGTQEAVASATADPVEPVAALQSLWRPRRSRPSPSRPSPLRRRLVRRILRRQTLPPRLSPRRCPSRRPRRGTKPGRRAPWRPQRPQRPGTCRSPPRQFHRRRRRTKSLPLPRPRRRRRP